MSPRLVCALEKFGECSKWFRQNRPWQKCCSAKHQKRLKYLVERSAMRRRRPRGRAQAASNAARPHLTRFSRTPAGKSRSMRNVLGGLAAARPEFFLRLAGSVPGGLHEWAAGSTVKAAE